MMVTNPLTKQYQVLPGYDDPVRSICRSPQFLMMVDTNVNNYKVLHYRCSYYPPGLSSLLVYDSRSMKWESRIDAHIQPGVGGWTEPLSFGNFHATACIRGSLYVADTREPSQTELQMDNTVTAVVRLFEVNIETGEHILRTEFPLCKLLVTSVNIGTQMETKRMLRNLELVECLGHVYAVIPAPLNESLYQAMTHQLDIWENVDTMGSTYMPLQFYIFQLEGEGERHHGVLRIEIPSTWKNSKQECKHIMRRNSLLYKAFVSQYDELTLGRNWFSCTARGSVIYVTIEDYLLRHDVQSGKNSMELLPVRRRQRGFEEQITGVAYRASFHMKP